MSRARGCLWLAVGLVLALAAGGIAFVVMQRATVARQVGPSLTQPVVVAVRPLSAGALLAEADLTIQNFPADALPSGAVLSLSEAQGKITTITLNPGEMVLSHHLTQPDITNANLGFTLPEGKVAVVLAAADLLSQSQLVQTGSRVDILYSLEASEELPTDGAGGGGSTKRQYTFGALQAVTIVGMITTGGGAVQASGGLLGGKGESVSVGVPTAYVLALEPQDALLLKYLKDAGATMDLALRNVTDEVEHVIQPVDLQYLLDRYQLRTR
jgi:pilus assembly protein CpaB